jgi:ParB/RepB/Spo0J family partition protein
MSTPAISSPSLDVRDIPIDLVVESIHNPRRHFTPAKMAELEDSIRSAGMVFTPLIARSTDDGTFELAAGHRRLRAAKAVGLASVPVRVVPLSDTQLLEVLTIENLQREDVHPLDEARGYEALMRADRAYTPKAIAAKVGKSESYVYRRLKLLDLNPDLRELFERDAITAAHAERLARLDDHLQAEALDEHGVLFLGFHAADEEMDAMNLAPLSALDAFIRRRTAINPASPDVQHYFPQLAEAIEEAATTGATLLELSEDYMVRQKLGAGANDPIPLPAPKWHEVTTKKDRCATTVRGVITHGGPTRVLDVCATKGCPKHFPAPVKAEASTRSAGTKSSPAPKEDSWQEQQRKRQEERQVWEAKRDALCVRLVEHLKASNLQVTVELVKRLVDVRSIQEDYGVTIGADNLGLVLALEVIGEIDNQWDAETFRQNVKPFNFDWRAAEKAIAAEAKAKEPKQTSAKTTKAKKGARK